ncbi:MAG: hypothetical protein JSR81_03660 [Proteobacteria bacterium]|nr:hypothetical protein [Pseudomonadota bacterium]
MASKQFNEVAAKAKEIAKEALKEKETIKPEKEKELGKPEKDQHKPEKDTKDNKEHKEQKDHKDQKDNKEHKEQKEHKDQKDHKPEQKEKHEKEIKDKKDHKELAKEIKDGPKEIKEFAKEIKEAGKEIETLPQQPLGPDPAGQAAPQGLEADLSGAFSSVGGAAATKVPEKFKAEKIEKNEKFEKHEKFEIKEWDKYLRDHIFVAGPAHVGPGDPVMTQRVEALEATVAQLLHFIPETMRPDLTQGALAQETDKPTQGGAKTPAEPAKPDQTTDKPKR